eukprot:10108828-Karenia_brevis.AAC.1
MEAEVEVVDYDASSDHESSTYCTTNSSMERACSDSDFPTTADEGVPHKRFSSASLCVQENSMNKFAFFHAASMALSP